MIKTIGIVSLSRGILGEDFLHHELDLGLARLKEFGVRVKFLPHALDGLESLAAHPEHRAQDLLDAFRDPEIDAILCAIGGDDTYRLAPYLFDHCGLIRRPHERPLIRARCPKRSNWETELKVIWSLQRSISSILRSV